VSEYVGGAVKTVSLAILRSIEVGRGLVNKSRQASADTRDVRGLDAYRDYV